MAERGTRMNSQATENGAPSKNGWGGARPGAGRPNGSYTTWFTEEKAAQKWGTLIERPPRCVCGERDYRYKVSEGLLRARCNVCGEGYIYDALTDRWVPSKFSTHVF